MANADNESPLDFLRGPRPGRLFVFAGPSGAGKSTICRALLEGVPGLTFSVSCTTRRRRDGETEGRDYRFLTGAEFEQMVQTGAFAEYALVHGHYYGTHREQLESGIRAGKDVLLDIDIQGASQLRHSFPDAVLVFVFPPSMAELEKRLAARGQNERGDIEERLRQAKVELGAAASFDYFIVNDALETAVEAAAHIIYAERQRIPRKGAPR
jgi:guanylate kinase